MRVRALCLLAALGAVIGATTLAQAHAASASAAAPRVAAVQAPAASRPASAPTAAASASASASAPLDDTATKDQPPRRYSAWWALFVIALSGAFGGFVDGMRASRSYKVRFGARSADWGSVADALVGMAASVAIFAFAESIFGGGKELDDRVTAWFLIKITAWGVLSGYAGTKLLDDLSSKAIRKMITDETGKQVSQQIAADQQAQQIVQEAEQMRMQHLARVAVLRQGTADEAAEQLLQRAILKLRGVLRKDPLHRDAQNGLANALADLGAYFKGLPGDAMQAKAAACFAEAIQIQDGIIRQDPTAAKAYYNRACYRAVAATSEQDRTLAAEDLKQAIARDDHWREYARTDPDLIALHGSTYWKREVAEPAAAATP